MKSICRFAMASLLTLVFLSVVFVPTAFAAGPQNLVAGVSGVVTSDANIWAGSSALVMIPGAALFPIASANTVLYLGFTAGSTADIGNMVIYKTARGRSTIIQVIPVTLGGVSNPSINLASKTVCPVAPSVSAPCTVRLDPTVLTLSPLSDYYFVVFFSNDTNNKTIGGADPSNTRSSLSGLSMAGDQTRLTTGKTVPNTSSFTHTLDFLMYVMTN